MFPSCSVFMMLCCAETQPESLKSASADAKVAWAQSTMRCKGCAAKVSPQLLQRVLQSLRESQDQATQGETPQQTLSCTNKSAVSGQLDDAVVLKPPPEGCVSVQTVDFVNSFVDDPFVFGGIVALHAMSDCFAMGAEPSVALAMVQVCLSECTAEVQHQCTRAECPLVLTGVFSSREPSVFCAKRRLSRHITGFNSCGIVFRALCSAQLLYVSIAVCAYR